jgi:hypothetical protein
MQKFKRLLLVVLGLLIIIVGLVILFISPIAKYLVEKYDSKYIGREVTMAWAYVNPFTGYVYFRDVKFFENKSDSVFLSVKGLGANFNLRKLFNKTYEISNIKLNRPKGFILQNNKEFNLNDLIEKFSSKEDSLKKKPPLHLNLLTIKIVEGEFIYKEKITPINYSIKDVNLNCSAIRWDVDTIPIDFEFSSGSGSGKMKGNFTVNSKNKDYALDINIKKFSLDILGQYIKDLSNYGSFKAFLDADFKSNGNLIKQENVTNSGVLKVSDFHFGKNPKDYYASFESLNISIHELSPHKLIYFYDSITLVKPFFKYERYDYLDNVQTMFGKKGNNVTAVNNNPEKFNLVIEIAKYIKELSRNFLRSNYRIDRVAIYDADVKYNDYTLNEKFGIDLKPFNFISDSVDKRNKRVFFKLNSGFAPFGNVNIAISINPKDSSDFDLVYNLKKISAATFNPYIIKYTSYALDRGTLELNGSWIVRNGNIKSDNHLLVIDPRVSGRLKNESSTWLPLRLIMFFVRERGNVIDYEIPITGNLNDPKFNLWDVIKDALMNVFIKPATTPYRVKVRNLESEIEKSLSLKWSFKNSELNHKNKKFLKRIENFIEDNDDAIIEVESQFYEQKEREYIMLFEAKKKYYLKANKKNNTTFNEKDSALIDNMSSKDALFIRYLNTSIKDSMLFTVQEKCMKLLGKNLIDSKLNKLNQDRVKEFLNYFEDKKIRQQIKFLAKKNVVPYNGFSFFKIRYKNEFPDYVLKAYSEMNELNNSPPRDKFKKERRTNKKARI